MGILQVAEQGPTAEQGWAEAVQEERAEEEMAPLTITGLSHSSHKLQAMESLGQPLKAWTAEVTIYWTEEVLGPSCPSPQQHTSH